MKKNKKQSWFQKWFNSGDYLELYKHRDRTDAEKIVRLLLNNITLKKGSKVLDLACGNGRHSILFARRGFKVTGVDLSEYLISKAKENLKSGYEKYKSCLKFEIGDMRHITHRNEFDLVINIFTSFGYFEKDSDNEKVIKIVSRALKPGGWFLLDFLNRDYLARNIVPFDIKKQQKKIIVQLRTISSRYVEKNILIFSNNRNLEAYPVLNRFIEKIRLYSNDDFTRMFKNAGLKQVRIFGSYNGTQYNRKNSERLIILAQKI